MVDSRSYDILNVEEVDELMKVRAPFQSSALIHPKLSIPGTRDAIARGVLQRNPATLAKNPRRCTNLARLNSSPPYPPRHPFTRILRQSTPALETSEPKVDAAQTEFGRVQEHAANFTWRLLKHRTGMLVTALAASECRQEVEEHDDGDDLLSSISSISEALGAQVLRHTFVREPRGHPDAREAAQALASVDGTRGLSLRSLAMVSSVLYVYSIFILSSILMSLSTTVKVRFRYYDTERLRSRCCDAQCSQ